MRWPNWHWPGPTPTATVSGRTTIWQPPGAAKPLTKATPPQKTNSASCTARGEESKKAKKKR